LAADWQYDHGFGRKRDRSYYDESAATLLTQRVLAILEQRG